MNIRYFKKDGDFMVSQVIEQISYYDLEGTLDKVISFFQKKKTSSLKEINIYDEYNDIKSNTKTVKFDYVHLEIGSYDGENQFQLVGYRKMTNEEKEVFEKEEQERNKERLERMRQQYEQLKKELNE